MENEEQTCVALGEEFEVTPADIGVAAVVAMWFNFKDTKYIKREPDVEKEILKDPFAYARKLKEEMDESDS